MAARMDGLSIACASVDCVPAMRCLQGTPLAMWLSPDTAPGGVDAVKRMAGARQALRLAVDREVDLVITPQCLEGEVVALLGVMLAKQD